MKVLLIGMDGAHVGAFRRGWTPYLESLINEGSNLAPKNDLLSRGWLEISTGRHASTTGALYDKPKANGTLEWDLSFSINDIPSLGSGIKPIWQALNELGFKVGVMNLPTVFPAPEVNGFFVSGGGGGASVVVDATPELCYPKDIIDKLHKNGYIVDQRIPQLVVDKKYDSSAQILAELSVMNTKRTTSFIELANDHQIDFGFVVYKTSSVTAETIIVPEINNTGPSSKKTLEAARKYYEEFDQEIMRLTKEFPSAEIVLVSDHGTIARSHTVNPNICLQKLGYQKVNASLSAKKVLVEKLKKLIPFSIKMALKKNSKIKRTVQESFSFDHHRSQAFCRTKNDWTHGIFINDEKRFGGPVKESDIPGLKAEIIEKINVDADALKHNVRAYSTNPNNDTILSQFPDIGFDLPSGYLTNDSAKMFIASYRPPVNLSSLDAILQGEILSMKSHEPLTIVNPKVDSESSFKDENTLQTTYKYIVDRFAEVDRSN